MGDALVSGMATLNWPDPETNRTADRLRFYYTDTVLNSLLKNRSLNFDG